MGLDVAPMQEGR